METDNGRKTYTINPRLDLAHGYQRIVNADQSVAEKVYVSVGGRNIALLTTAAGQATQTQWMHQDHLGSVIAVTDAAGKVIARCRNDAWGRAVQTLGSTDPARLYRPGRTVELGWHG